MPPLISAKRITYSGDYAKSEAGTHRAKYSVDANKFDSVNYEQYIMPSGLDTSFEAILVVCKRSACGIAACVALA